MTGRPLEGRTVLVTRPPEQAGELSDRLRDLGAFPIEAPVIRTVPAEPGGPLDAAVGEAAAGRFSWIAFTSVSAVRAWFSRADALGAAAPRARLAAVGDATAEALRDRGVEPDLVPAVFTTAALGEAFPEGRGEVLLPRADLATPDLHEALARRGWNPVRVDAYRTVLAEALPADAGRALDQGRVDAITFTSPSTVEGFVRLAGVVRGPAVVVIGPVTAGAAGAAGFEVAAEGRPHTVEGLLRALIEALGARV